jgi:hypothetical protein
MADKNWVTVQPTLGPILDPINTVIATIDSVLGFLITLLNVVQAILNVVKVFLVGLLDPIRAIVEVIIEEIRNLINDLRQLGVYFASDSELLEVTPVNRSVELRGGFVSYERRMLARLLNREDPTRPDFSSSSAVLALFAYISSGDLAVLADLIARLRTFFGAPAEIPTATYPPPTTPESRLGVFIEGTRINWTLFTTPDQVTTPPDALALSWTMPSTGELFGAVPGGFMVHVSTVPDGFGVRGFRPKSDTSSDPEDLTGTVSVGIDPQTGLELRLYGGFSDLNVGSSPEVFTSGKAEPHAVRLYLSLDQNTPLIPPADLKNEGGTPHGAATYYFKAPALTRISPGQQFSCVLQYSDLPKKILVESSNGVVTVTPTEAQTFYIRVRPVTSVLADRAISLSDTNPNNPRAVDFGIYTITTDTVNNLGSATILTPGGVVMPEVGPASQATVITFPSDSTLNFIEATKTALTLLILCRADLKEEMQGESGGVAYKRGLQNTYATGHPTGLESFRSLLTFVGITPDFYEGAQDPSWANLVLQKVEVISRLFLSEAPSSPILDALAEEISTLLDFRWSDINEKWPDVSILGLAQGGAEHAGVAGNPAGIGNGSRQRLSVGRNGVDAALWVDRSVIFPTRYRITRTRTVQTITNTVTVSQTLAPIEESSDGSFRVGMGNSDYCPVIWSLPDGELSRDKPLYVRYIRRLMLGHNEGEVLSAAAAILGIAGASQAVSPSKGSWKAIRLFEQSFTSLDKILQSLDQFMQAILDGLEGAVDKIVAYIEAVQARIYQIQALLNLIRSLLNSLTAFDLPSFTGLLLVENGTDGIVTGLITAGNKPSDGSVIYGGGAVVLAGGLPTVLLELLALVLGGSEEG